VEERSECLAVIIATHKISITVTITLTVPLSLYTRVVWAAASSSTEVATTTPWATLYLFSTGGLWLHTAVVLGVEERSEYLAVIIPTHKISFAVNICFTVSFTFHTRTGF